MRSSEAKWVGDYLLSINASVVVNLGSSTADQRQSQPHTNKYIWEPLARRGVEVLHVDLKHAEGVDIAGDIFEPQTQHQICAVRPDVLLCCNMLEHVPEPRELARICEGLCHQLIVTVPFSYPYHADPIDTMYRPSPEELASLFKGMRVVESAIIPDLTMWQSLGIERGGIGRLVVLWGYLWRMIPWLLLRPRSFGRRFQRLLWLNRPYAITCAVFRK